jgi:hypothetical protein
MLCFALTYKEIQRYWCGSAAFKPPLFLLISRLPYQVQIEEATRTIVITGSGEGITDDTLNLIAGLRDTFREHRGYNLLYDSSAMSIASSPNDMMRVATALFEESETAFGRIAVVVPEVREGLARIFAALAHPHGVSANVFTHAADARRWLGIDR